MCEYCGCQALPVIEELTREHDRVVGLIGDVRTARAAGDVPELVRLARQISVVLRPHTEVEEHGLFPPLAQLDAADWLAVERVRERVGSALRSSTP